MLPAWMGASRQATESCSPCQHPGSPWLGGKDPSHTHGWVWLRVGWTCPSLRDALEPHLILCFSNTAGGDLRWSSFSITVYSSLLSRLFCPQLQGQVQGYLLIAFTGPKFAEWSHDFCYLVWYLCLQGPRLPAGLSKCQHLQRVSDVLSRTPPVLPGPAPSPSPTLTSTGELGMLPHHVSIWPFLERRSSAQGRSDEKQDWLRGALLGNKLHMRLFCLLLPQPNFPRSAFNSYCAMPWIIYTFLIQ